MILFVDISDMFDKDRNDCCFPLILKTADVNPYSKDDDRTAIKNYQPVSHLRILSALYEGEMKNQITEYMPDFSCSYLLAYIKECGPQYCLLIITEM